MSLEKERWKTKTEPFCFLLYSVHILKQTTYFYSGKSLIIKKKVYIFSMSKARAICIPKIFVNPIKVYIFSNKKYTVSIQAHTRQINDNIFLIERLVLTGF